MPVHLDTHDPDLELTPGTTKSDVVAFLYANPDLGYKPAEIRDELDIPRGTATATLTRLHDEGLVGKTKDGYYHALDRREDIHRYVTSLDQLDRLFDRPTEEATDAQSSSPDSVDEDALDAEVADLEDEFDA